MVDVVLFHHVQGLTDGVRALAAAIAGTEHRVHTPDLYDGHTFGTLGEGFAYRRSLDDAAVERAVETVLGELPAGLVFAGISWGVGFAQPLAQTRPDARGALLFEACFPISGDDAVGPWPSGLPVQIHGMDHDEFFALEGDLEAAREIAAAVGPDLGEVFTYPGDAHLFIDDSLPSYDSAATALVVARARDFLGRL